MPEPLDYASAEQTSTSPRWLGWTACAISVALSVGMGIGAIRSAMEFRAYVTNGIIAAGRTSEDLTIAKELNTVVTPALFVLALVGCIVCARGRTGGWFALAALLIGLACWIASLVIYH